MKLLTLNPQQAFLDIETSWSRQITVIGVYRPGLGTRQLVRPGFSSRIVLDALQGVEIVFTYNGSRFDLPVIEAEIGLNLSQRIEHRDLMHDCWARNLYGGLKRVEQILGIHRDTEGVDGLAAMNLWERYRKADDAEALEVLLRYNREDVENLETLALKLGVLSRHPEEVANPSGDRRRISPLLSSATESPVRPKSNEEILRPRRGSGSG